MTGLCSKNFFTQLQEDKEVDARDEKAVANKLQRRIIGGNILAREIVQDKSLVSLRMELLPSSTSASASASASAPLPSDGLEDEGQQCEWLHHSPAKLAPAQQVEEEEPTQKCVCVRVCKRVRACVSMYLWVRVWVRECV